MRIPIAKEVWPFVLAVAAIFGLLGYAGHVAGHPHWSNVLYGIGLFLCGFMFFFFRDPERTAPADARALVSGADGVVRSVERIREERFLKADTIRISVFLSVFNVHVNRSPMAGAIREVQYTPGRKLFAFLDAASEYNEHSSILIEGEKITCLVRQIVGPVARRVVCWLTPGQRVEKGERIGIMKFGSRLDIYLPSAFVTVPLKKGDRVVAGQTVLAILKVSN